MKRRRFLQAVGGVAGSSAVATSVGANPGASPQATDSATQQIERVLSGVFIKSVPEGEVARKAALSDLADAILSVDHIDQFGTLSLDRANEQYFAVWRAGNAATYILPILESHLDVGLSTDLPKKIRDEGRFARNYLPFLAGAQQVYGAAKAYDRNQSDENARRFGIALLVLIGEFAIAQYGVPYKLSFALTGSLSRHVLLRFRGYLGTKSYALLLSELHWLLRGQLLTSFTFIVDQTAKFAMDVALDGVDLADELQAALSPQLSNEEEATMNGVLSIRPQKGDEGILDEAKETLEEEIEKAKTSVDTVLNDLGVDFGFGDDCDKSDENDCKKSDE